MPGWLDKLTNDMGLSILKSNDNKTVIDLLYYITDPVEKPKRSNVETTPKEPKVRDCLCAPNPKDPQPCVLKCD